MCIDKMIKCVLDLNEWYVLSESNKIDGQKNN